MQLSRKKYAIQQETNIQYKNQNLTNRNKNCFLIYSVITVEFMYLHSEGAVAHFEAGTFFGYFFKPCLH